MSLDARLCGHRHLHAGFCESLGRCGAVLKPRCTASKIKKGVICYNNKRRDGSDRGTFSGFDTDPQTRGGRCVMLQEHAQTRSLLNRHSRMELETSIIPGLISKLIYSQIQRYTLHYVFHIYKRRKVNTCDVSPVGPFSAWSSIFLGDPRSSLVLSSGFLIHCFCRVVLTTSQAPFM